MATDLTLSLIKTNSRKTQPESATSEAGLIQGKKRDIKLLWKHSSFLFQKVTIQQTRHTWLKHTSCDVPWRNCCHGNSSMLWRHSLALPSRSRPLSSLFNTIMLMAACYYPCGFRQILFIHSNATKGKNAHNSSFLRNNERHKKFCKGKRKVLLVILKKITVLICKIISYFF